MQERQLFVRDVLAVLFKRKWMILFFALVVFAVVFVGNYVWPETYESVAKIRIIRGAQVMQPDPTVSHRFGDYALMQVTRSDVNSEIELLRSRDVLRNVVRRPELQEARAADRSPLGVVADALRQVSYALSLTEKKDSTEQAIEELDGAISVEALEDSYVIAIRVSAGTAQGAHDTLEALLEEYEAKHLSVYETKGSLQFFKDQIEEARRELTEAQGNLRDFREANDVVHISAEKDMLLTQYQESQRLLTQLEESAEAVEALGEEAGDAEIMATLSRETDSTVVTELQLKLLELVLRRNDLKTRWGAEHPDVQSIDEQITEARDRLLSAIASTAAKTADQRDRVKEELKKLNNVEATLNDLEREVDIWAENYEYYSKKREEARVSDERTNEKITSIRTISEPSYPSEPVVPKRLLNLALAILVGVVGGVALAFFFEWLDHGLKNPEDVEHYLQVRPLASFFKTRGHRLEEREAHRLSGLIDAVAPGQEAPQVIGVTSARPGESANQVAASLAEAYAAYPERTTLLITLDGAEGAGEAPPRGMMDVVAGAASLEDAVASRGAVDVMGRGEAAETPSYVWKSDAMQRFLDDLRSRYDRVVLHLPPILSEQDAVNAAAMADGFVVAIAADRTRREVVERALDSLGPARVKVLGAVLTEREQVIPELVYKRI